MHAFPGASAADSSVSRDLHRPPLALTKDQVSALFFLLRPASCLFDILLSRTCRLPIDAVAVSSLFRLEHGPPPSSRCCYWNMGRRRRGAAATGVRAPTIHRHNKLKYLTFSLVNAENVGNHVLSQKKRNKVILWFSQCRQQPGSTTTSMQRGQWAMNGWLPRLKPWPRTCSRQRMVDGKLPHGESGPRLAVGNWWRMEGYLVGYLNY